MWARTRREGRASGPPGGIDAYRADMLRWQQALLVPLTILAWVAVAIIAAWLLGHVVKTVLTLVLAGVVAFALTPVVSRLQRVMPTFLAITIAYILGFALLFGLIAFLVITAADQVTSLAHSLPNYATRLQHNEPRILKLLHPFGVTKAKYHQAEQQAITYLQGVGTGVARSSVDIITTALGTIVDVVLVLILSVYLTANGTRISQGLRRQTPSSQRRHMVQLIGIVNGVVGGYVRGQLTLAVLVGIFVGAGMYLLHVPYAVLLGVLAFFMEFVPVIGVLVSGAVCLVIALFQGYITALLVLGYFVVVHVLEGDVVGPRIMGKAVGIHPATAIIALVAGTELFGVWGALFGAPLAGLLQAIVVAIWKEIGSGQADQTTHTVVEQVSRSVDQTATPDATVTK